MRESRRQNVVSLAKRNLADRANQRQVACQSQLLVQIAGWSPRTELLQVDAVMKNKGLFASQPLGDVKLPCCCRDGQQAVVAIEIGDRLPAQGHDVAEVRKARQRQLRGHGARQSSHGQAVGVEQGRAMLLQNLGEIAAEFVQRKPHSMRVARFKWHNLDALRPQGFGQGPRLPARRREPGSRPE